jgi:hypothetical protein
VSWEPDAHWRAVPHLLADTVITPGGLRLDLVTGRQRPPLRAETPLRQFAALLPAVSGPFVAGRALTEGGSVAHLWESLTGRPIAVLPDRLPDWTIAAHSPTGRLLASADDKDVVIHDLRDRVTRRVPAAGARALAFSPDGRFLATGLADSTVVVWEVPAFPRNAWNAADVARLWDDLAGDDTPAAWKALWHLLDYPDLAAGMLEGRLRPVAPLADTPELIDQLNHPRYATREEAMKKLARRGEGIEGELRAALKAPASEEQRTRLEGLLNKLDPAAPPVGDGLRGLRGVWLLERLGTPAARRLLGELAGGAAGSRVTLEARAALDRWPR